MATATVPSSGRILQKALELFSSKGYDGTSVREICEAAEITKPTLYHFYGSKEGVYQALVQGSLDEFRQAMVRELGRPGTPLERLKGVARTYFDITRENRELMRFFFALVHNPPSSAPPIDFTRSIVFCFREHQLQAVNFFINHRSNPCSGLLGPG